MPYKPSHTIGASEFKSHCLELLDIVFEKGSSFVVTKHGVPVARVEPVREVRKSLRGLFAGKMILGDIENVDWSDDWEANK
jgi:prevent-host-death family protein